MGESCDSAPAPPPWPQSRQSLTESFSTQTTSPAPPSSLRGETVCLAPSSTRARGNSVVKSFICFLSYSVVNCHGSLVQRNVQSILGEASISNIIYVLHHHIYYNTPYNSIIKSATIHHRPTYTIQPAIYYNTPYNLAAKTYIMIKTVVFRIGYKLKGSYVQCSYMLAIIFPYSEIVYLIKSLHISFGKAGMFLN